MKFGKDQTDELLDDLQELVLEDRKKLRKYFDGILENVDKPSDLTVQLGSAEMVAKLSDSLVKTNAQLLEIVKLRTKGSKTDVPAFGSAQDREDMLDEISGQEIYSAEEDVS